MTDAKYQYTFEPHHLHGSEIDGQDFPFGYITKFRGAEKIPLEIRLILGSKQENLDVINYIIVSCNEYPKLKEQNGKLIEVLEGILNAHDYCEMDNFDHTARKLLDEISEQSND